MAADKPNPFVYDIEMPSRAVAESFTPQIALLHELCCYGSNLLMRSYAERDRKLEDAIILGCLLRQFLIHLDAVYVLLSKGCAPASFIHLRAMLEEQFYFEWLFKEQTALRAKHLYVWNLRKRRSWNLTTDPNTPEGKDFDALLSSEHAETLAKMRTPQMRHEARTQNVDIDRILSDPDLARIDRQFTALRGNKKFDPDWYAPCGPTSVFQIAREVGMIVHYRMFYSKWSESMHSSGFFEHVYTDSSGTSVEQVRSLERFDEPIRNACTISYGVLRLIINRYRPGENEAFARKYMSEWRERFFKIPKVNLNHKVETR